jgi:hypothetical protein
MAPGGSWVTEEGIAKFVPSTGFMGIWDVIYISLLSRRMLGFIRDDISQPICPPQRIYALSLKKDTNIQVYPKNYWRLFLACIIICISMMCSGI